MGGILMGKIMRYIEMPEMNHEMPDLKGWKVKQIYIARPGCGDDNEYFTIDFINEKGEVVGLSFDTEGNWYYGEETEEIN
jgi:hypothetical protein